MAGRPADPAAADLRAELGLAFGHQSLWSHLVLGLAWAAAFAVSGLVIFQIRTRTRRHPA